MEAAQSGHGRRRDSASRSAGEAEACCETSSVSVYCNRRDCERIGCADPSAPGEHIAGALAGSHSLLAPASRERRLGGHRGLQPRPRWAPCGAADDQPFETFWARGGTESFRRKRLGGSRCMHARKDHPRTGRDDRRSADNFSLRQQAPAAIELKAPTSMCGRTRDALSAQTATILASIRRASGES